MYIVESGETQLVEANPDAIGLKLGIIYETRREKQELLFHRFTCNNDSILTVVSMEGTEIDHYGGKQSRLHFFDSYYLQRELN